jgi:hypothetical protein
MAITQYTGPMIVGGRSPAVNNYRSGYNPDDGPSLGRQGWGRFDPRFPYAGPDGVPTAVGWQGNNGIVTVDAVPATASATILAAAQAGVTNGALALTTTAGNGITILSAPVTVYPAGVTLPAGTIALDGTTGMLAYGQSTKIQSFDPRGMLARALVVTWAGNDASASVLVKGYDVFGYAMSQSFAGASGIAVNGTKAFKFITSAAVVGTASGANISLGTLDVFGLPIRADSFGYVDVYFNNVLGTATGFVAAVTATATSTTGDVRGTYAPGTSNGVKSLQMFITPNPVDLQVSDITGMAGVTQA